MIIPNDNNLKYISFKDDYIYAKLPESLDIETIGEFFDEYTSIINETKQATVVYDGRHINSVPGKKILSYVKERMGYIRKSVPEDKDAIVIGNHPLVKITFQSILTLTGFSNMKFFTDLEEAINWVKVSD